MTPRAGQSGSQRREMSRRRHTFMTKLQTFLSVPRGDYFHPVAVRILYEVNPHVVVFEADAAHLGIMNVRRVNPHMQQITHCIRDYVTFSAFRFSPRQYRVRLTTTLSLRFVNL
jgi:hypothetical protein